MSATPGAGDDHQPSKKAERCSPVGAPGRGGIHHRRRRHCGSPSGDCGRRTAATLLGDTRRCA